MKSRNFLTAMAAALTAGAGAPASDWPRFRGPNGTGVSEDKNVPVRWNDEQNLLWKVTIPGTGYGSPVVSRGKLFLQSAAEDGTERMLLCLDVATGRTVWTRKMPGTKARIHRLNSRASSTPAADGERVYSVSWDGKGLTLYAHDFDGTLVWDYALGGHRSQHGAGGSPIVHDGRVLYVNDQDGASEVVCLDARSGKVVWKQGRKPFRACYSTPFVMPRAGGDEVIVATTAGITSYDLKGGGLVWNYNWTFDTKALRTVASPVLAQGLVVANSGDGSGDRHAIAVHAGGKGDVTKSGLAWETTRQTFPYVPSLLTRGDHVYGVNDKGLAFCNVARTGASVWSERLGSPVTASPVLIDGKVYIVAEDGKVYVFEASPTFKLLATNAVNEAVSATPAVADNRLFVRGQQHLFCIGNK